MKWAIRIELTPDGNPPITCDIGVFTQTCQMYRFVVHSFSKTIYNPELTRSRKTREKARFRDFYLMVDQLISDRQRTNRHVWVNTPQRSVIRQLKLKDLVPGMILDEELVSPKGIRLVPAGHEVTRTLIVRLTSIAAGVGVVEPFRVRASN